MWINISIEIPEHIICPQCKNQIKLGFRERKINPEIITNDIFCLALTVPYFLGKTMNKRPTTIFAGICNHCKEIIGIGHM